MGNVPFVASRLYKGDGIMRGAAMEILVKAATPQPVPYQSAG